MDRDAPELSRTKAGAEPTLAARPTGPRPAPAAAPVSAGRAPACLHRLFEARAAAEPGAVAVSCEAGGLTYGELNARANRLARRLRALGVGPETRVGVVAGRSVETVVGLLAVLKAG